MAEARGRYAVHALRSKLKLTPQQAEFVAMLYEAGGAAVPHTDMDDALTPHWTNPRRAGLEYISTIACHVRKKLGREALQNNYCAYSLTDVGMAKVAEALAEWRPW